jgi:hypothetical protein
VGWTFAIESAEKHAELNSAVLLFVNPTADVRRTIDEVDTFCLKLCEKPNHFDVDR